MLTVGPAARSPPELAHAASEQAGVSDTSSSCICNVEGAHEMSVVWINANMCSVHRGKTREKQQISPVPQSRRFMKKSEEAEKGGAVMNKESRKDGGKRFAV